MWNKLFKSKSKKTNTTTNKSKSFLCRSKNKKNDPTVEEQQQKCDRNVASTSSATGKELRCNQYKAHPHALEVAYNGTSKSLKSFISRSTRFWNDLPNQVYPPDYNIQKRLMFTFS